MRDIIFGAVPQYAHLQVDGVVDLLEGELVDVLQSAQRRGAFQIIL